MGGEKSRYSGRDRPLTALLKQQYTPSEEEPPHHQDQPNPKSNPANSHTGVPHLSLFSPELSRSLSNLAHEQALSSNEDKMKMKSYIYICSYK
eukprot:scaffold2645_cov96-Skeletonema_dohrnii-CCMP3373.AAC.2